MPVNIYVNFQGDAGNVATNNTTNNLENNPITNQGGNYTPNLINNNPQAKQSALKTASITMATMMAQQTISYALSNVGQWTGNQQNQLMVNNIQQAAGIGMMAVVNPWLTAATVGINLATTAIDEAFRKSQESVVLSQARARAGYTSGDVANYRRR